MEAYIMVDVSYMNLPTYLTTEDESSYHQYLNQSLRSGLSEKGWTIPQITKDGLINQPVQNPSDGSITTLKDLMPNGTIWCVVSESPHVFVGKLDGQLVQFTTTPYS